MTGVPDPLLQILKQKHADAHDKMCADNATPEDVLFFKGMWLAYNDAIGDVEHSSTTTSAGEVLVVCPLCKGTGTICGFWMSTCTMCGGSKEILAELRQKELQP